MYHLSNASGQAITGRVVRGYSGLGREQGFAKLYYYLCVIIIHLGFFSCLLEGGRSRASLPLRIRRSPKLLAVQPRFTMSGGALLAGSSA